MSYKEKRTIVSILSGAILLVAYYLFAMNKINSGDAASDDLKFWATTILIFIGIGIAITIVIQIVFHILLSIKGFIGFNGVFTKILQMIGPDLV